MKNYRRALWEALQFWPSLLLATLCSVAVAFLWGGNILAFYPVLQTTLKGNSVQAWVAEEIASLDSEIAKKEGVILGVKEEIKVVGEKTALVDRLNILEMEKLEFQAQKVQQQKLESILQHPWVPRDPFRTVAYIVILLMVSTVVKHIFLIANELLVGRAAIDISRNLRKQIFAKAMAMDRKTFSSLGTSGFSAHITHTAEGLSQGLMNTLGGAVREPLKILSCLVVAGIICWRLLLISLIVAPVVGFLLFWITRRLKSISHRVLIRASSFHEVMLESLGNIQTVQAYTMEHAEQQRFENATKEMRNYGLKFVFYTALTKPVIEFLGLGMLCITIIGGAYLLLNHKTSMLGITISDQPLSHSGLLIFFGALIGASDPLRKLSMVYSSIYAGSVAADALYPLLDQKCLIQDCENPLTLAAPHKKIELSHITFGYREDHVILNDVTLDIPFGQTVAIVGHNGSGKSTLISLLCRFYDPIAGQMLIDGIDLRQLKLNDLRKRIALVNQHTELFNETILYNIAYGTENATEEEIVRAAKEAHAHDFISSSLPDQYQTRVGHNGQRLSGGQRQRIALARALLRDPEILILDESTSQIDMQSEELIRDSLSHHRGKRTMIIITHREALLDLADVIYEVKDQGLLPVPRHRPKTIAA